MARGFESKDVEYQQAEAERLAEARPVVSAAEREVVEQRRSVELSLTRMRTALQTATVPAHRQTIEAAIAALEAEWTALSHR